jgi:hypothetical protein
MDGEKEAQGFDLVLEHEGARIGRRKGGFGQEPCRWRNLSRCKQVQGSERREGVEEPQGLPHELRSGCAMSNRVKASGLDEDAHVLEMNMAPGSKKKIIETCERTVLRSFVDDKLHSLPGDLFELHEPHPDFSFLSPCT